MLTPINVDVPLERAPWTNWAIIALNVVCFGALMTSEGSEEVLVLWREEPRLVQFVGAMYGHADILHLAGNMLFLFCFGNAVNSKLGHLGYLAAYHALGILSTLAWLALGTGVGVTGASGAIMGVIGLFVVYFPLNDVKIFYWLGWFWTGTFDLAAYWVVLFYLAFDLWGLALSNQAVAYIAHIGGMAGGIGLAILLLKRGHTAPGDYEKNLLQVLAERRGSPARPAKPVKPSTVGVRTSVERPPGPTVPHALPVAHAPSVPRTVSPGFSVQGVHPSSPSSPSSPPSPSSSPSSPSPPSPSPAASPPHRPGARPARPQETSIPANDATDPYDIR